MPWAVVFDVGRLFTDSPALGISAYYMIAARVITGIAAAVFGIIDEGFSVLYVACLATDRAG